MQVFYTEVKRDLRYHPCKALPPLFHYKSSQNGTAELADMRQSSGRTRACSEFIPTLDPPVPNPVQNFLLKSTDKNNLWTWSCQPQFNEAWCEAPSSLLRHIPHSEHFLFFFFQTDVFLPLVRIPSFSPTRNKINGSASQPVTER